MTSPTGNQTIDARRRGAFTLIELILIMAIITVTAAIVTPALTTFFRGREQEAEAERILSLTRYGQSRAVSEGVPTVLWINPQNGTYGLQLESGYTDTDRKSVDFTINADLRIDVARSTHPPPAHSTLKLPAIHFSPDGTFSPASVTGISIQERDRQPIWVSQAANGLNYEIR